MVPQSPKREQIQSMLSTLQIYICRPLQAMWCEFSSNTQPYLKPPPAITPSTPPAFPTPCHPLPIRLPPALHRSLEVLSIPVSGAMVRKEDLSRARHGAEHASRGVALGVRRGRAGLVRGLVQSRKGQLIPVWWVWSGAPFASFHCCSKMGLLKVHIEPL